MKWHRVATRIQDALIASSDAVKKAHARRGKECKGAMSGDVSAACQKADQALTDAVVDYLHDGGAVPDPRRALRADPLPEAGTGPADPLTSRIRAGWRARGRP